MSKTVTAAALYASYVELANAAGVKPVAIKSFKNKAAILEATDALKPRRGRKAETMSLSGKNKEITVSLTKTQRAMARRWFTRLGLERPLNWVGASVPVEIARKMGI